MSLALTPRVPIFRQLSGYQWLVLGVAWLGWVFDIADTALFTFAKVPMLTEMLGPEKYAQVGAAIEGQIQMTFLVGWAIGGLVFGIAADKYGRTRVLILTILLYCLFTGLTALCQTWEQVTVVRFLTGLGIGGEWAAGAALVAEVMSDRARPFAAALLQTAAAIGPVLAGTANLALAGQSWKWLFLVGVAPALLTVVIRSKVREPERWQSKGVEVRKATETVRELFRQTPWRRHAIVAMILGVVGIAGAGNVAFWLPNLVKESLPNAEKAVVDASVSYATYTLHLGTLLGVFAFPLLCQRIGRKASFALFFVLSPLATVLALQGSLDYTKLLWMAPIMAFFAIGLSAGYGLYFPELFPTRLRATGCGLAYNTARIFYAPIPWLTGLVIGASKGSPSHGVALAAMVYIVGLLALPFAPETKGKPLPD
ncbi:MAG: MFS transporter [Armatimonadetes bacterium]|nr:MFS transporter [Armatimonadota bacterium]NOG38996.1 MFS transporter [Armatimonadota bacterium]GIK33059.1 MAG: MFS transporter [Armatimonadota bacterium]